MKELVIAAYDRDYSWVNDLVDVKITVYRKGTNPLLPNETLIDPNVGRDVHTFFYHLYENYDNLSDITFFSQDYPFDHVANYIDIINGDTETRNQNAVQYSSDFWIFNSQRMIYACDQYGSPHHPGLDVEGMWNYVFNTSIPTPL
jgi:hypothetical protein